MTPFGDLNRLRTFEVDGDETLVVAAGRGEIENRTIFHGHTDGRYAIVPVDELTAPSDREAKDLDLLVDELEIVGKTSTITKTGEHIARLTMDGLEVSRNDAAGVYGLFWIPADC